MLSNKKFLDKENLKRDLHLSALISDFYYIHSFVSIPYNKNNIFACFKYGSHFRNS